jgi:RsiW-degrading membrane proteinase PrsW (M82 family)
MNPLSGVLDEAWRMYRAHAAHLLTIAFVIYLVTAVVVALLALAGGVVGALLGSIVELFAAFLLQATLIKAVQDVRDGRADLSFGDTVSAATPYIWPVAAASILAGIAITVGLILVIVPGLILITIWAVIIPVIVLERSGALASFGRSQQLVRGNGWHVFGTLVLVFIILIVVNIVLGLVFVALPIVWRNGLSTVISGTLIAPFIALVVTLIYYRLSVDQAAVPGPAAGRSDGTFGAV